MKGLAATVSGLITASCCGCTLEGGARREMWVSSPCTRIWLLHQINTEMSELSSCRGISVCDKWSVARLLVCRRKEGKYLTFVHAWWSSQQLCACTWDPINKASGRLSTQRPFASSLSSLAQFMLEESGGLTEGSWMMRERGKKNIPVNVKPECCTWTSSYLCWLLLGHERRWCADVLRCVVHTNQTFAFGFCARRGVTRVDLLEFKSCYFWTLEKQNPIYSSVSAIGCFNYCGAAASCCPSDPDVSLSTPSRCVIWWPVSGLVTRISH